MDNTVFMNNIFLIFNRIISILLLIFGFYFFWTAFSFMSLGTVFHGGSFAILIDLLLELSLISIWIFSYSFVNKNRVIYKDDADTTDDKKNEQYKENNKEADTADDNRNKQYKDWF